VDNGVNPQIQLLYGDPMYTAAAGKMPDAITSEPGSFHNADTLRARRFRANRTKEVKLELVLQGELNLPVVSRSTSDASSSGLIHSAAGQAEIGVVQHVEEFGAELNLVSFT